MAGTERVFTIKFLGDVKDFVKGVAGAGSATDSFQGKLGSLAGTIGSAYAVDKVVEFSRASIDAATEDAAAQTVLATTLRNVVGATDDQVAATEDAIWALQDQTGVLDDELRPALATIVRSTKDTAEAQDLLRLAMDVSAGTGRDLETVSLALARAHDGNTTALGRMGVAVKDAEGNALSFSEVQANLNDMFGGQAAAAADTAAGKAAILSARYGDLQETIGAALLPIMSEVVGVASSLLTWFGSLDEGTQQWIVRVGLLGGGLVLAARAVSGITEAMGMAKAAVSGVTGAMSSQMPILLAVGAAIAAGVYLYSQYTDSKEPAIEATEDFVSALKAEAQGQQDAARAAIAAQLETMLATDRNRETLEQLGLTVEDVARAINGEQTPAMAAAKARFDELDGSYGTVTRAARAYRDETGVGTWAAKQLFDGIGSLTDQFADAQAAQADSAAVMDDVRDATEGATLATEEQVQADKDAAEAAKEREDAIRSLVDAIIGAAAGDLAYRDAQRATTEALVGVFDATAHLNDENEETRTSLADVAAALDDAQSAMMRQASAAADTAKAHAEANGELFTSSDYARVYRQELINLANTLGPDDPLRIAIEGLIGDLGSVPSSVETTATFNDEDARAQLEAYTRAMAELDARFGASPGGNGVPSRSGLPPGIDFSWLAGESKTSSGTAGGARLFVGESGPEVLDLTPDGIASIVANHDLAMGGGVTVIVHNDVTVQGSVISQDELVDVVHNGLIQKRRDGGDLLLTGTGL